LSLIAGGAGEALLLRRDADDVPHLIVVPLNR
jgi:hypothetical protein